MSTKEHRKSLSSAWAEATRMLRDNHDVEFHTLLAERYAAKGILVTKRSSRLTAKRRRLDAARALLEDSQH